MASTQVMADQTTSPQALASRLRDYYTLTKPEVNLLILMTTSAGYYLGSEGEFKIERLVSTLIGTLLVASGTATLNQFMERRYDAQMRRTANRPQVSGCCRPLILKESLRKQQCSSSRSSWYWRRCSLRWQAAGQRFCSVCPRLARSFSITPASWRPQIQNFCRAAWYTLPSSTYL